jgi:hypothetical protein
MKLSKAIQSLLEEYTDRSLMLITLLERTGDQGFGVISALLTLPMLVPLPVPLPGLSAFFGAGTILMGLQMALGWRRPRLPPPIARLELSPTMSHRLLKNLKRILYPIERLARPRLLFVSQNWLSYRIVGLCLFWNALLMSLPLPIPLTNLMPAYTILVLAIGILELDGFLLLFGYGMTLATTAFFASVSGAVWVMIVHLIDQWMP